MDVQFPFNNFSSTLASTLLVGDTSLTLATGGGTGVPALSGAQYFILTISDGNSTTAETVWERVRCTTHAVNSDTFSGLTRGFDGTTERQWPAGSVVSIRWGKAEADLTVDTASAQTIAGVKTFNDGTARVNGAAVLVGQTTAPTAASSGEARFYANLLGASAYPRITAGFGDEWGSTSREPFTPLMPWFAGRRRQFIMGAPISNGFNVIGSNNTAIGTAALVAWFASQGSQIGEQGRITYTSTAAINTAAGISQNLSTFTRGANAGRGGFECHFWFTLDTFATTSRLFVGLTSDTSTTGAMVTADPSGAATDFIGLACDAADTDLSVMTRNNVTTTKTALTTARTKAAAAGRLYWLTLAASPNAGSVYVRLLEWAAATYTPTTLVDTATSTTLPRNSVTLRFNCLAGTGSGAAAVVFGMSHLGCVFEY